LFLFLFLKPSGATYRKMRTGRVCDHQVPLVAVGVIERVAYVVPLAT